MDEKKRGTNAGPMDLPHHPQKCAPPPKLLGCLKAMKAASRGPVLADWSGQFPREGSRVGLCLPVDGPDMMAEFAACVKLLQASAAARCVVLQSATDHFCIGANPALFRGLRRNGAPVGYVSQARLPLHSGGVHFYLRVWKRVPE